jgi:hypothetical protein
MAPGISFRAAARHAGKGCGGGDVRWPLGSHGLTSALNLADPLSLLALFALTLVGMPRRRLLHEMPAATQKRTGTGSPQMWTTSVTWRCAAGRRPAEHADARRS